MNCGNNKNSAKNIILIGIIVLFFGGYLYTQHPAWLVGSAPLFLLICCPLMMLMMGCMNKSDKNQDMKEYHSKDDEVELEKADKDNIKNLKE